MSFSPQQVANNTTEAFITALVTNVVILGVQVGAFSALKKRLERIYAPRTFLPPPGKRANRLPSGPWRWLPAIIMAPTDNIIDDNGLDAYMFLRFLKMLIIIFFVFTITTFAIIIPIDTVNVATTVNSTGLHQFNWENLTLSSHQDRFSAHIIVVYLLTFFVIFMIRREMMHFVLMQQRFLISKSHSRLAQARTVLITSIPDDLANEKDMRLFASFVPGGIDRIWFFRDTKELNKLFAERRDACAKLEAAELTVLRHATKAWRIKQTGLKKTAKKQSKDEEKQTAPDSESMTVPEEVTQELFDQLVPPGKRPKHRTGFLGLFGTKVDTIEYCKTEVSRLNPLIAEAQAHIVKGKFLGSAFIRCNLQMGAHVLAQCVSHHKPLTMYDKWLEVHPKDIVWENLSESAVATRSRTVVSWLATVGLILAWVFPVGFVGTLSNVSALCQKVGSLSWICHAHAPIPGIIQGVLPPIILAALFALVPLIFRALAWYECIPRYSLMSVSVYRRFFFFLLIHGFLIVTLTSGITAAIVDVCILRNPASTIQSLANRLPGASTFFLTYMVSQGLAGAGIALIQLGPLLIHYFRKWFLGRTPRQAFDVTYIMPSADFGVTLPLLSLLAVIAFAYSVISPLINVLAFLSFSCMYVAWKFLILQVLDQPDEMETSGRYFPMAISRVFIGLYVEQVCLACLFFLKISISRIPSIIDAATMIALLVITVTVHIIIYGSFHPITNYLPMTLATRKMAKRYEREQQRKARASDAKNRDSDPFGLNRIKSVRQRLAALPRKVHIDMPIVKSSADNAPEDPEDPAEMHDEKTDDSEPVKDPGEVVASGSSARPGEMPDFFRHLSVPEVDKHDQYNRDKRSPDAHAQNKTSRMSRLARRLTGRKRREKHVEQLANDTAAAKTTATEDLGDDEDDEESSQDEADFDEHAFDHPSTYKAQPWIWIPKDTLGLSALMVNDLKTAGVQASDTGAVMDSYGVVEVLRSPPDEQWYGGEDR